MKRAPFELGLHMPHQQDGAALTCYLCSRYNALEEIAMAARAYREHRMHNSGITVLERGEMARSAKALWVALQALETP